MQAASIASSRGSLTGLGLYSNVAESSLYADQLGADPRYARLVKRLQLP